MVLSSLLRSTDDARVARELERVFDADRYQTSLPGPLDPRPPLNIDLGWLGTAILLFLAATAVVLLIRWLLHTFASADEERPRALSGAGAGVDAPTLEDPDELARRGLFAEAVHALLVNAIALLRTEERVAMKPSMTSRELLACLELSGKRLEALRYLVAKVEISIFGGRDLDRAEYVAARGRFRELHPEWGG